MVLGCQVRINDAKNLETVLDKYNQHEDNLVKKVFKKLHICKMKVKLRVHEKQNGNES